LHGRAVKVAVVEEELQAPERSLGAAFGERDEMGGTEEPVAVDGAEDVNIPGCEDHAGYGGTLKARPARGNIEHGREDSDRADIREGGKVNRQVGRICRGLKLSLQRTVTGMHDRSIYLSGPITGYSYAYATEWRAYVSRRLPPGIAVIDPMRDAVDFSTPSERQLADSERLQNIIHGKEVLDRNRIDVARCDLLLVNFLGASRVSIGSVGEIFWADVFRKPVIIVREAHYNIHDHGLVNAISCCIFEDLDSAIGKINALLQVGSSFAESE
jgi:hypothetical protein